MFQRRTIRSPAPIGPLYQRILSSDMLKNGLVRNRHNLNPYSLPFPMVLRPLVMA